MNEEGRADPVFVYQFPDGTEVTGYIRSGHSHSEYGPDKSSMPGDYTDLGNREALSFQNEAGAQLYVRLSQIKSLTFSARKENVDPRRPMSYNPKMILELNDGSKIEGSLGIFATTFVAASMDISLGKLSSGKLVRKADL